MNNILTSYSVEIFEHKLLSWNYLKHKWPKALRIDVFLYWFALEQYEILLKANPDDQQVRRKYALVLSWAGRKAEAIKELRQTLGK